MAGRRVGIGKLKFCRSIDPDEPYPMKLPKMGHSVIVNNIASELPGSKVDVEALKVAHETVGFDAQVHEDCSTQQMRKLKRWIMDNKNHEDSNCFSLTVISHGNKQGHLLDKNKNRGWDTEEFLGDLSEVETLNGKPKLVVLQSCRGTQWTTSREAPTGMLADDEDLASPYMVADKADLFLAYAAVPGYTAYAGDDDMSVYLQAFATYLQQYYKTRPLDKIYMMVKQAMIRCEQGEFGIKQAAEERNSLTRVLHFGPFHGVEVTKMRKDDLLQQKHELDKRAKRLEEMERKLEERTKKMEREKIKVQLVRTSKATKSIEMTRSSTFALELRYISNTALLDSTNKLYVRGCKGQKSPMLIFVLSLPDGKFQSRELNSPCSHIYNSVKMICMDVGGVELMAYSCGTCWDLKLINLSTQQVERRLQGIHVYAMCRGERNTIFVARDQNQIYEIEIPSNQKLRTINTENGVVRSLCYASSCRLLVINYDNQKIEGITYGNRKVAWTVSGEVAGKKIEPESLLFLPQSEFLLIADQKRILILNPSNGNLIQTVDMSEYRKVSDMHLYNDKVIIRFGVIENNILCYFSLDHNVLTDVQSV